MRTLSTLLCLQIDRPCAVSLLPPGHLLSRLPHHVPRPAAAHSRAITASSSTSWAPSSLFYSVHRTSSFYAADALFLPPFGVIRHPQMNICPFGRPSRAHVLFRSTSSAPPASSNGRSFFQASLRSDQPVRPFSHAVLSSSFPFPSLRPSQPSREGLGNGVPSHAWRRLPPICARLQNARNCVRQSRATRSCSVRCQLSPMTPC